MEALEEFWRTVICINIKLQDGSTMAEISCDVKDIAIIFTENDVNKVLDFQLKALKLRQLLIDGEILGLY